MVSHENVDNYKVMNIGLKVWGGERHTLFLELSCYKWYFNKSQFYYKTSQVENNEHILSIFKIYTYMNSIH